MFVGGLIYAIGHKFEKFEKIPITIVSKSFKFKLKYQLLNLMRSSFNERGEEKFKKEKQKIEIEIEEQDKTDW